MPFVLASIAPDEVGFRLAQIERMSGGDGGLRLTRRVPALG
jgi:hypothetical protein